MEYDKRLLVVDDEEDICESIKAFLERRGYAVTYAIGGKDAIEILSKETFPVILLDLKMPHIDGWKVLEVTKSKHPDAKYIVLTGLNEPNTEKECKEAGAYDFIVKPIRIRNIYERLERLYNKDREH